MCGILIALGTYIATEALNIYKIPGRKHQTCRGPDMRQTHLDKGRARFLTAVVLMALIDAPGYSLASAFLNYSSSINLDYFSSVVTVILII